MAMRAPSLKPADSSAWLPLALVAAKLAMNAKALARKCDHQWQKAGVARKVSGRWEIHSSADPRLRDRSTPSYNDLGDLADLAAEGIAPKYLDAARSRLALINGFSTSPARMRFKKRHQQIDAYLAAHAAAGGEEICRTTYYNWLRDYEANGIRGLVSDFSARGKTDAAATSTGEAALFYMERILNAGNRIPLTIAYQLAKAEAMKPENEHDDEWRIGSYTAVRLALLARRPKIMKTIADKGPRAARAACVPKLQRDFESIAAGEEYCGDERHLDIWCRVFTPRGWKPIRPWLTAWQDMRSRMIVGWMLAPHANRFTILGSVHRAIMAHGRPRTLRTDQGKDYRAAAKHGAVDISRDEKCADIFKQLGITVRRVEAYTPWTKPIESFFRTMKDSVDKAFGGFWGGCPSERHEDRARYLKENLERVPTIEVVEDVMRKFFDVYHATPHSSPDMFGKTPAQAMEAFRVEPARMVSEKICNHLFCEFTKPKLIRRDGISHNGRWYGNGHPRLVAMRDGKTKVILAIRPADQSRARVCDLNRKPLFTVDCLNAAGLSREQLAAMARERRDLLKPYAARHKAARTYILATPPEELLDNRLRALRKNARPPVAPVTATPPLTLIDPALEDAIDAAGPLERSEAASRAARTGTDDRSIDLAEIATMDMSDAPAAPAERPSQIDIMDILDG